MQTTIPSHVPPGQVTSMAAMAPVMMGRRPCAAVRSWRHRPSWAWHRWQLLGQAPGRGYTHTSVAIRDAIAGISTPVIEVHISNIYARESFRQVSLTAASCKGVVSGLGMSGYHLAVKYLISSKIV